MDQFLDFEVNGMFEQNFWCINFISISIWKTLELKKDKRMCFDKMTLLRNAILSK